MGPTISIPCVQRENGDVELDYPLAWQGPTMQCRKKISCADPPVPPPATGLAIAAADVPAEGYFEFDSASYSCSDPAKVLWSSEGERVGGDEKFQVACYAGGDFMSEQLVDWPTCDSDDPPRCTEEHRFQLPNDTEIELVEAVDVVAGGSIYYRCKNFPIETSNLGDLIKVA